MTFHDLYVKLTRIKHSEQAFDRLYINPKWMLQGKIMELILKDHNIANRTFDFYQNKLTKEQRFKLLSVSTNFEAYKGLRDEYCHRTTLSWEEKELLVNIMLDETREDEIYHNPVYCYILGLIDDDFIFTDAQIDKITNYILQDNDYHTARAFYKYLEHHEYYGDYKEQRDLLVPLIVAGNLM